MPGGVAEAGARRASEGAGDEQSRVVLTAHPLQRVGAYALVTLGKAARPEALTAEGFRRAMDAIVADAANAALVRDTKSERGFWLKCSLSFFPNSKMNHPGNAKKSDADIREAVGKWLSAPDASVRPGVACVLCGRAAVGFFGKMDVPLAESDLYRNTTPRGHEGLALCRPCLCCFRALPYGCRLTGGPASALHSWDERFMARTISRRVERNRQLIALRAAEQGGIADREVLALRALRGHEDRLTAGVELLLFSNDNRNQKLEIQSMDQPMAEWLRRTARPPHRIAFPALLRAHATKTRPGIAVLARNAFEAPERIAGACSRYLTAGLGRGVVRPETGDLVELCMSFLIEVMRMNQSEVDEINAVGRQVAAWLYAENSAGQLRAFYATLKDSRRMRSWLRRRDLDGLLDPDAGSDAPLITEYQYRLLFDPEVESAWLHREVLLVSVVQRLHELGFKPADRAEVAAELQEEDTDHPEDRVFLNEEES